MTAFQKGDKAQVLIRKEWIDCEIVSVVEYQDELTYNVRIENPDNPKHPFINYVESKHIR